MNQLYQSKNRDNCSQFSSILNSECLFCRSKKNSFQSKEHIIPESLGNNKLILQKGVVCDKCNNGVLSKLDQSLAEFSPIAFFRTFHGIKNKKGTVPMSGFNNMRMGNPTGKHVNIELDKMTKKHFEKTSEGFKLHWKGNRRMNVKNVKILTRALYKIGLETIYLDHGANFTYSQRFDEVRKIILGKKDFSGYLLIGTNKDFIKPNMESSITYRFLKSNEDDKEFALFEFNYFLVKIFFDMERRVCKLNNKSKLKDFSILKF